LLDNKRLIKNNKQQNSGSTISGTHLDLGIINSNHSTIANTLDKIIDKRLKSDGQKRKYDDIRASAITNDQKI
jgi:hypothetical protein